MPTPEGVWIFHDEQGPASAVAEGLARAKSEDWTSGTLGARARALQGLTLETARLMGALAGTYTETTTDGKAYVNIEPAPVPSAPDERRRASVVLYRSLELLAQSGRSSDTIETFNTKPAETGAWPLIAAVVVVGIAQVAAIGYIAHQAALVVDRQLERKADLKKLAAEHAQTLALVDKHVEREKQAGKALPLDDATKLALNSSIKRQDELAKKVMPPLSSGLPNVTPPDVGGFGLGLLAAAAVAAWLWFKG
jgi:hypothetical protein